MVYKESPLCSQCSVCWAAASLLNKLASRKLWYPLSHWVLLQHFWRLIWDLEADVFTSLSLAQHFWPTRKAAPARHHRTVLLWGEGASPSKPRRWVSVAQRNLERLGNQPGSPTHHTGKNPGSNSGLPQEAEREFDQFSKGTQVTPSWGCVWNCVFRVQGAGWKYCAVWGCVKVWACNVSWLWSKCGVLIRRSVVNSYGLQWALTGPLVQVLYGLTAAKAHTKSRKRRGGDEWSKWCYLFCPCVPERFSLPPLHIPHPFHLCL
jgi:hypothetical protein